MKITTIILAALLSACNGVSGDFVDNCQYARSLEASLLQTEGTALTEFVEVDNVDMYRAEFTDIVIVYLVTENSCNAGMYDARDSF